MSENKTPSNPIREKILKEAEETVDELYADLVVNKPKGRLPEPIFRDYYLKYFTGEIPIEKDSPVIAEWVGIAGTPSSEVDIIDSTGKTLFVAPPLFNTDIIDPTRDNSEKSFVNIYSDFMLKSNNIPAVANNHLARDLATKSDKMVKGSSDNADRWKNILERYDLLPSDNEESVKSNALNDDDLVFDD